MNLPTQLIVYRVSSKLQRQRKQEAARQKSRQPKYRHALTKTRAVWQYGAHSYNLAVEDRGKEYAPELRK